MFILDHTSIISCFQCDWSNKGVVTVLDIVRKAEGECTTLDKISRSCGGRGSSECQKEEINIHSEKNMNQYNLNKFI